LHYQSEDHTKIKSVAKGLYSSYDGSGYIFNFDHSDEDYLSVQREKLQDLEPAYFKDNTKAVIVNYNLHYSIMNVNLTAEVLFEVSPVGNVRVNPLKIRLFVLDYNSNRKTLYLVDIMLQILNLVYFAMFVMIIMNQQRDQFLSYCLSKEGVLNWAFTVVSLWTTGVFATLMYESSSVQSKRDASVDYLHYYNDFTWYIDYYELYKLLKSTGICILLVRFSLLISKTKKGSIFIESVDRIGDKFIFILLINIGVVFAFTIMYCYGTGMYFKESNTFPKAFLVLTNFTLRNSLFYDLEIFNGINFGLFMASYLMLISIVGVFLQVLFADAVKNVFIEHEQPVTYDEPWSLSARWAKFKVWVAETKQKLKAKLSRRRQEDVA